MYVTEACNVYLSHLKLMPEFTISFGLLHINFAKKSGETFSDFSNLNCSNVLGLRKLQEPVKKYSVSKILLNFHCTVLIKVI